MRALILSAAMLMLGCATTGTSVAIKTDAVSFEDDLRAKAAGELGCDAKALTISAVGESRTSATVSGCGKKANYSRVEGAWVQSP